MKKSLIASIVVIALLLVSYIGLWLYSAQWFNREIGRAYAESQDKGFRFLGEKPTLTGFPFIPEVYYAGGFQVGNVMITFPEGHLRGYPIPGLIMRLSFPRGIQMEGNMIDPAIWSASSLDVGLSIPYRIPADANRDTLAAWQESGGKIEITDYKMLKQSLDCSGYGLFKLDENLQPVVNFTSTMKGYPAFIEELNRDGIIDPFGAAIATGLLNGLASADEDTGENEVILSVTVQNRMLSVGPLQVGHLPEIVWGTHSPPVLRQ
jgi:hypothetical protein